MNHRWLKAKGRRNWTCACGCLRQVRSVRVGSGWGGAVNRDQTFFSTPEQQARGTCSTTTPPCTRTA